MRLAGPGVSVRRVVGLAVCVLSASLGTSAANVALPQIADAFGGSFGQAQWVVVAYLLGMTAASVTVGYLGDVFDRTRLLAAGAVVFAAAAVAVSLAPSFQVLVTARAIQGVGAAVLMALPLAIARDTTAEHRTGSVMGLLGTTSAVGTAAGPAVGGLVVDAWGWQAVFAAMVPFGLAALLLNGLSGPGGSGGPGRLGGRNTTHNRRPRSRFDAAGMVILTATVALYALGVTGIDRGADAGVTAALLGAAAAGVIVLVLVERRAAHPVLPLALLGDRIIGAGAVANLIVGAVMMTTLVVGPFYLSEALGLGSAAVGLVMAAGPVASILSGIVAGRLVDRLGTRRMITAGLAVMIAGAVILAWLPATIGLVGYLAGIVALAPGYQLFLAANNTQVMTAIAPERRGTASGLLGLSRNLGLITGTTAMGVLFAAAAGASVTTATPAELTTAVTVTFVTAAAAVTAALLLMALVGTRPAPTGPR